MTIVYNSSLYDFDSFLITNRGSAEVTFSWCITTGCVECFFGPVISYLCNLYEFPSFYFRYFHWTIIIYVILCSSDVRIKYTSWKSWGKNPQTDSAMVLYCRLQFTEQAQNKFFLCTTCGDACSWYLRSCSIT